MTLKVVFWDVQHGSAAYIKTPNETHIVHDLGTGSVAQKSTSFSPLLHLKGKYGVKQLDYVIITHPHQDHIADILNFDELSPRVLTRPKHLTPEDIRQGNQPGDNAQIDKYLEINSKYSAPIADTNNPKLPDNNGGVEILTFSPTSCDTSNLNNHSIVTVLNYAGSKILLPGDNEPASWEELLENSDLRNAIAGTDILLAPHHGRQSAFYSELFDHFKPKLTVISDGPSETSAVDKYRAATTGWTVHKRSGGSEERKCVTTRKDGVINVTLGYTSNGKPFIEVRVD